MRPKPAFMPGDTMSCFWPGPASLQDQSQNLEVAPGVGRSGLHGLGRVRIYVVPHGNTIQAYGLGFSRPLGSYLILACEAAEDGSSADPGGVEVDDGGDCLVGVVVWDVLGDALVRARRVVVE